MISRLLPLFVALLLPLGAQAADAAGTAERFRVNYETVEILSDGVTHQRRWEDLWLRAPGHVWTERQLPRNRAGADDHGDHGSHEHFDFQAAARHVSRDPAGQLQVEYIERAHSVVVYVSPSEWDTVGFGGDWDNEYFLLAPPGLKKLSPLVRKAAAGTRWYGREHEGRYLRVLWSEAARYPLLIESGYSDNSRQTRVQVTPLAAQGPLPWTQLQGFERKDYNDFLD